MAILDCQAGTLASWVPSLAVILVWQLATLIASLPLQTLSSETVPHQPTHTREHEDRFTP